MRWHWILALLTSIILSGCSKSTEQDITETADGPTLTINIGDDPQTLDPRKSRSLAANTLCRMLFEGLTRLDKNDEPVLALAERVDISEDQKTYLFTLKEAYWSDGSPITAYDFEYSWKTVLDPLFPAPQAHLLFPIKMAKQIKINRFHPQELGARALDDRTLSVELERPTPYFLKLLTLPAYLPVNSMIDREHKTWSLKADPKLFTWSGPFRLTEWRHYDELVVEKNQRYWDADQVQLGQIRMTMVASPTAFMMFKRGELDWAGSPLDTLPEEAIPSLKASQTLYSRKASATEFYRLNTTTVPFSSPKVRQAFGHAINRSALVTNLLEGNYEEAYGLVPPSSSWEKTPHLGSKDATKIRALFEEGLAELEMTREELPTITLLYSNSDRTQKIAEAVQQDWKRLLNVDVQLQSVERKVFWDRLKQQDYQIAAGNWFADVNDPADFLGVFSAADNGSNNTEWEDAVYANLLEMSGTETDPNERSRVLHLAEKLLMEEMPIIPLFHYSLNYSKNQKLIGVHVSELGWLDFKGASIREQVK